MYCGVAVLALIQHDKLVQNPYLSRNFGYNSLPLLVG